MRIKSGNGSHFVNNAIRKVGSYFGIDLRQLCAYHPASGGTVEQKNGTLKNKIVKCCKDMGLAWMKALPIVLLQILQIWIESLLKS